MKNIKLILTLFALVIILFNSSGQSFLKAKGTKIVDDQGEPFLLRGMGLGGWMLQEGYMLQINNNGMQFAIKNRITDLIGQEKCDEFYDLWLQNHVTESDVEFLANSGFNSIRLPMHYNLFTLPIEDEPTKGGNTWLRRGFEMTDSLLSWCKKYDMYLILDLHAAPGGQGKDANISDYDSTKVSLWESPENKEKTISLWRKLAERYANESTIAGYDLLNEPNWSFEGKHKNGISDTLNAPIWDLYKEITKAIREVDTNHIIFIEGNGWGNNYRGFPGSWDDNMVLSFHKYWNNNSQGSINFFIELSKKHNMPLWLGESGENSNKWFTEAIALMERNDIGWAWWPLKKIGSVICPLTIPSPEGYDQLLDYWNNKTTIKPSAELSNRVLFQFAENLKFQNNEFNKDIIDAMFRQTNDATSLPYKDHVVPCTIEAVNFDLGREGVAYSDVDNENIGQNKQVIGNKGKMYRNEGVDINNRGLSGEVVPFYVTSIEDDEWLQYTFTSKKSKQHKLFLTLLSNDKNGLIQIELNGQKLNNQLLVPDTNGEWKSIYGGKIKLNKGENTIRIHTVKGGYDFSSFTVK